MKKKRVGESRTEQVYLIRTMHINSYGRLFGGYLMQWIDEVAGVVARRHSGSTITTAAVDNLSFKEGAHLGDLIVIIGRVTYTGKTSMEVLVETFIEDYAGNRHLINKAYVVMVAVDEDGKPVPVPGLILQTDKDRTEWQAGERRTALRKKRRVEDY